VSRELTEKKLKFAVIGLGKMGLLHASLLSVLPNVKLVALCDKSTLMNRLFRKIFSTSEVEVVNDLEKLSELYLDGVYVTTPISSHSFIIKNLYEKGITRNIFVEKTLASNYQQAKELCEISKKIGGITSVGYMKRFSVIFEKAKELLSQGKLGELHSFKAYAYSSDFLGLTKESKSSLHRGGALRDIGCHVIDLALWLLGDLEVSGITSYVKAGIDSETSVSFETMGSAGLKGQFDISQSMPDYRMPEFGLIINCSKGRIDVNDDRLILTLANSERKKWFKQDCADNVPFFLGESEYFREDQQFVNSLLNSKPIEPNFDTASKVDLIINQVRESEKNG
jgi:predicted dehydrogenase